MNEHDIADKVLEAAKQGNDGIIRLGEIVDESHCLADGPDLVRRAVCKSDSNGATPMHWAAAIGGDNMVDELSRLGGDAYARDKNGQAPIHWAVKHDANFDVVLFLAKHASGFNPYLLPDNNGNTPLHLAMAHNHEVMVHDLKREILGRGTAPAGADPSILNARNKDGDAPLHLAADKGATNAIEELFADEPEPDINVLDGNGNTPLDRVKAQQQETADTDRAVKAQQQETADTIRGLGGKEGKH